MWKWKVGGEQQNGKRKMASDGLCFLLYRYRDSFRFYHTIEYEDMCACIRIGVFLVDFCWRVYEMKALCADLGSILQ